VTGRVAPDAAAVASPPRRRPGRPATTTTEDVVAAARSLVLREGYDALTVNRVAAELRVSVFAVHRHIGSKSQLVDEVVAGLLEQRAKTALRARTWRGALVEYATEMLDLLREHPTVLEALQREVGAARPVVVALDQLATLAEHAGVPTRRAALVYDIVWSFVTGTAAALHARAGLDEAARLRDRADGFAEDRPGAAALVRALAESPRVDRFDEELRLLVDALTGTS